jgi:PST family polysaccharide transporter
MSVAPPLEKLLPNDGDENRHFSTAHLSLDLGRRTARGGAVTIASQGIKFFTGMAATVVLARLLTPQDYGLIGMVAVVTGFISMFKDLGLSAATIQKEKITADQINTLFWVNVGLSIAVMLLTVGIAPGVAWFYGEPRLTLITIGFAAGFLFGGLTVQHEALLRRQMRFGALASIEIISIVVGLIVAITLARRGAGYWSLVANQLAQGLTYAIGIWITSGWRPGRPVKNADVRSMLVFGGNLTGFGVINYFGANLDNLLVARIWGAQQLGLYAKAYQLLLLPVDQINSPVSAVAVPSLSRLTTEPERYRQAYLRVLEKITILTMPLAAFMIATSDWLVRLILGPQWDATARIFTILGFAALLLPVLNSTGWLFISQNRTRDMLRWGFFDVSLKVVSVLAGLPWGAKGVAIAIVIRMYVQAPLLFRYVGRKGPVRATDFYRAITPSLVAFLSSLVSLFALRGFISGDKPVMGLLLAFIVTASITFLTLICLARGRAALQDLKSTFFLLVTRRAV